MTFVVLMRRSFLFEKEQKDMFISLAQRKGTKETSTPSKASPLYWEDATDSGQRPTYVRVLV